MSEPKLTAAQRARAEQIQQWFLDDPDAASFHFAALEAEAGEVVAEGEIVSISDNVIAIQWTEVGRDRMPDVGQRVQVRVVKVKP